MAIGVVFSLSAFSISIFNADPWKEDAYELAPPIPAGMPAPPSHDSGPKADQVCSSCHAIIPPQATSRSKGIPIIPPGAQSPANHIQDGRAQRACIECHKIHQQSKTKLSKPVKAITIAMPVRKPAAATGITDPNWSNNFANYRFQGHAIKVVNNGANTGSSTVYILLDDGVNKPKWMSLAPLNYLVRKECTVSPQMYVKGTAFREKVATKGGLLYGRYISVNGEDCRLRNNAMIGMWLLGNNEEEAE